MSDVSLIYPNKEYKEKAFDFIQEFYKCNSEINGSGGLEDYDNYDEWLLKVERDLDLKNMPEGRVAASTYFLVRIADDKLIGIINIRHKLNEFLYKEAGHIGYSIRPGERNKGYATKILSLGLKKCKELNIDKVLLTCDKKNIASAMVIQNNNGILEKEVYSELFSEVIQRYWINV